MSLDGGLEYAYARLCARFAEHPDELAWRSIEAIRALPPFLEAARNLPLKRWLVRPCGRWPPATMPRNSSAT